MGANGREGDINGGRCRSLGGGTFIGKVEGSVAPMLVEIHKPSARARGQAFRPRDSTMPVERGSKGNPNKLATFRSAHQTPNRAR